MQKSALFFFIFLMILLHQRKHQAAQWQRETEVALAYRFKQKMLTKSELFGKHNWEFNHCVNGKWQTVDSCLSQKRETLRFSTCPTLLRSYSIYLVKRQERSLIKSRFSVFWQKGNFILPFAVNLILNLSNFE